jgi:hypothetical protein
MGRRVFEGGLKGAAILMIRRPGGGAFSKGFPGIGVRVSFSSSSGVYPPSLAHLTSPTSSANMLQKQHCVSRRDISLSPSLHFYLLVRVRVRVCACLC